MKKITKTKSITGAFLLTALLATPVCYSQKKTAAKPPKKTVTTEKVASTAPVLQSSVPFKLLDLAPSRPVPEELIKKLKEMGVNISSNTFKIPAAAEKNFMYDYFLLYGEKQESYLSNLNGTIEKIPADTRLITATKNNSKIFTDKCINQVEMSKCSNIRIIGPDGKKLNADLSRYYFALNMKQNLYNSEDHTYVIVYTESGGQNIITESGSTFFPSDLFSISFIVPGFIIYEEKQGDPQQLMQLNSRKKIDISKYDYVKGLEINRYLIGKKNDKYFLIDPTTDKVLFESDKRIQEVYYPSDVNPENYFALGNSGSQELVDINGKKVIEGQYARFGFYVSGNTFSVENLQGKGNYYDLAKKAFVYGDFYNSLSTEGPFNVAKYNGYIQICDNATEELLYGASKNVKELRFTANMYSIEKHGTAESAGKNLDIYDRESRTLLFENVSSLGYISGTESYYKVSKETNGENKYTIVNRKGKVVIPEIIVPDYIRYNSDKKVFELTKKNTAKAAATDCYDLTGTKINCQ
ncbi:hypothetical protein [Flavobacterium notoginsengisoli]|uniref:hypothetical protein n=1 Tax=Flavobacterium notoginsengisoli TaxID=1478199 RepID=UPI00362E5D4D